MFLKPCKSIFSIISLLGLFILYGSPNAAAQGYDLFVALRGNHGDSYPIQKYDGITGAFVGPFTSGIDAKSPWAVTFGSDGNLYVVSYDDRKILRYNGATGAYIDDFVSSSSGGLSNPVFLAFGPDGHLYVVSNNDIMRYDEFTGAPLPSSGNIGAVFTSGGGPILPEALVFGTDNNLYVSDVNTHRIVRYNGTTGVFIDDFVPSGSGGLSYPVGLTFGPDHNLYVSKYASPSGGDAFSVLRYNGTTGAFIDEFIGPPNNGGLDNPTGLVFGPDGNLYVSSIGTRKILRYNGATGAFIDAFASVGDSQTAALYFVFRAKAIPAIPVSALTVTPTTVAGGKTAIGTVKIKSTAPQGGELVALASTNSAAHVPANIVVPSGMTSASFTITTDQVSSNVTGAIKATSAAVTKSVNLTVRPISVQSVTLVPSSVTGGGVSIGVVTLEERSTIGDTTVLLSSNNGSVAGPLVVSITIPEGSSSGSFTIGSNPVSTNTVVTIKATANGLSKSANLTVKAPAILSLTLIPSVVIGGDNVIGIVFLNSPAGPGGKTITVSSNDPAASPDSLTCFVPEGSMIGSFNISTTTVVSIVHAKITASSGGVSKVAALTINP